MKKGIVLGITALMFAACHTPKWSVVWEDNFDGNELDTTVWSRTYRGRADWQNTQSLRPDLLEIHDGILILKGVVNPNPVKPEDLVDGQITLEADTAHYLTAGIQSYGKHAFTPTGKIEVRARLNGARGGWPAIWLMPFDRQNAWPKGGEIDMMERLNYDDFVYQTVHTHYSFDLGHDKEPPHYGTQKINPDDFNIYGVEFHADSLVFSVNGNRTFAYPRVKDKEVEALGQYPFIKDWFMLIDNQLGGKWVGPVSPEDLPVNMEIDWVRQYKKKHEVFGGFHLKVK